MTAVAPALCLHSRFEALNVECRLVPSEPDEQTPNATNDVLATLRALADEYPVEWSQICCGLGHMAAHWLTHHTLTEGTSPS